MDKIEKVVITTHESALRIIDKIGPLHNPADRDHCLQYMTAIGLIFGRLSADDYEDKVAADPRIDELRAKMFAVENKQYSQDYLDAEKRSIANAVQVFFKDGTFTENVAIEYPIGHRRRRKEGIPQLVEKFENNLQTHYPPQRAQQILVSCHDAARFEKMPLHEFVTMLVG